MRAKKSILGLSALLAAGFATLAGSIPAQAHSIWFAQRARQLALIYGVGADDLDAVGWFNPAEPPELAFPTDRLVLDQLAAEARDR